MFSVPIGMPTPRSAVFYAVVDDRARIVTARESSHPRHHRPLISTLYTHALECVFEFLSLRDLSAVLCTWRSQPNGWSAIEAIDRMRPINACVASDTSIFSSWRLIDGVLISPTSIITLCSSRLARHIGSFTTHGKMELDAQELQCMTATMNSLQTLHCSLAYPVDPSLLFPRNLTALDIRIPSKSSGEHIGANLVLEALGVGGGGDNSGCWGGVPTLRSLTLRLSPISNSVIRFNALRHCTLLREFNILSIHPWTMTKVQAVNIRSLAQLDSLGWALKARDICLLLPQPAPTSVQDIRWNKLRSIGHLDGIAAAALGSLPALTSLEAVQLADVTFLRHLPGLHSLQLFEIGYHDLSPSNQFVAAASPLCAHLTCLTIRNSGSLTSDHMLQLLSLIPSLRHLHLIHLRAIKSLEFLSAGSLVHSLETLEIVGCSGALEPEHIFTLQNLTDLTLAHSFKTCIDPLVLADLAPPSLRLPKLIRSDIDCPPRS